MVRPADGRGVRRMIRALRVEGTAGMIEEGRMVGLLRLIGLRVLFVFFLRGGTVTFRTEKGCELLLKVCDDGEGALDFLTKMRVRGRD